MWQFIRSRILTLIIFIGAAHGILVVGPNCIRPNQNYTVVISNFNSYLSRVDLMLRIEGQTEDGRSVLNLTKSVGVWRYMSKMVNFNMPADLSAGNYTFTIDGQGGFNFNEQVELVYLSKPMSGVIQTNKPAFAPGDTVKFRVIVLDTALKPPAQVKTVHVTVRDHDGNVIQNWPSAKLHAGVFESDLQIASAPVFGVWNISVQVDGEELVSKTFEVKEYVLPAFDLEVTPSVIPLEEHQGLNLTIAAHYQLRKPVIGLAKVEFYLEKDMLDQKKQIEVYGMGQVELQFVGYFKVKEDKRDVFVKTTFIEQHTNRTVVKESQITVYKHAYRVQLIKETPPFRPGLPFKCALQCLYHDGTPAKGITGKVEVLEIGYEATATSDNNGLIKLELNPSDSVDSMYINFSNDDDEFYFYERVGKENVLTNAYIKVELRSPIKLNRLLQFIITCSKPMTFFAYFVMSKGNIIDSGAIRPSNQNKYIFRLNASEEMSPKAKFIVATEVNGAVVYDYVNINFKDRRNNLIVRIDKQTAEPGQQIELQLSGRPGAYVGLAAHNKGSMYRNEDNDSFWDDIMRMYNGYGSNAENVKVDKFHSLGLFVRTFYDIKFNEAHDMAARYELQINEPIAKQESNVTSFPESWLWENVSIGRSGVHKMNATVSDTITSWYLTAFSIDPEYGLDIIKKPIQFTTVQPFYIVDNLPHSIKRYEAVELQFILFNLLEEEYMADVTLYNVDNQMRFVARPLEEMNYIKSVSVPSKVGVPISFLVKAQKLEAIVVRVKATVRYTELSYALEKVIRVTPESLVQSRESSRFFCFDTYQNKTFRMYLDVHNNAENGSQKIEFRLQPNLLTHVVGNLKPLHKLSSDFLEENMVWFVPNIMMLDYLHAIGSKEEQLIDKVTDLSYQGYRNLKRFQKLDGSFVAWNKEGHLFLTTFVAKTMQTASKYLSEFDETILENTYDWLAANQDSSGRFDEISYVIHANLNGAMYNSITMTSYVVTALLENENARRKHAVVIEKAIRYLSGQVKTIEDPYELAIVTYALMLNGHNLKNVAFKRLVNMSTTTKNGTEQYWDTENSFETTAYALLSYVLAEKNLDLIPLMRWLVNQNFIEESYARVQSTFVGLKALTKVAEIISPSRNNYTIEVTYNQHLYSTTATPMKQIHINSQQLDTIKYENIPQDTRWMDITVVGIGSGILEVIYQYSLNLVYFENRFVLNVERQNTTCDYELRLNVCASFIPTSSYHSSSVAAIEVTFPNGYDVDQHPVSEQTNASDTMEIVVRFGGTSVVVYYDGMDEEQKCFTVTAYRRGNVTMKHPGYVVAYDVYNQHLNAFKTYEVDKQDASKIYDPKQC
ncbi:thioester-containing protein 1 allele S3-like [Anopheles marshallii]|uniref:thioester-containing protein 1 allele S3-like n=1 Tax=Anopheles marshallii TaxID=1521116 RepID=UPI00237B9BF6|nr:thioester-containing protein 1 allele S3-like [Anopheles marshallii]